MKEKEILKTYLPEVAVDQVYNWIIEHKIHFRISRSRRTKLGDYRPPGRYPNHRISINHDLNKYAFLITFVHELAHLRVYEAFKSSVPPHGTEWKKVYRELLLDVIGMSAFPGDLEAVLKLSIQHTKASSTADIRLSRVLKKYDAPCEEIHLEDLEPGVVFSYGNGRQFKKGEKVRTRFKCQNLHNKRVYLFHPLTPVMPVH
jgi:hypothetical protein